MQIILFLQFCFERTVNADYKLPEHGRLKALVSADAKVVGAPSVLLSAEQFTSLGAHLPSGAQPPLSAFVQIYSTARNGFSVTTLVAVHAKLLAARRLLRDGLLLVLRDADEQTFGFFTPSALKLRTDAPYGDAGSTFLFKCTADGGVVVFENKQKQVSICFLFL